MRFALITCSIFVCVHAAANAQTDDYLADPESDAVSSLRELFGNNFLDLKDKSSPSRRSRPSTVPLSSSPYAAGGWDYRFDAQYQSTIKPYLRWYMRSDPANPGQRYLPRYMTERNSGYGYQNGGYGGGYMASMGCGTCGGSSPSYRSYPSYGGYGYGGSYLPRSRYWQHLDYLYHQYGSTPQRPRRLGARNTNSSHFAPVTRLGGGGSNTGSRAKDVWLTRNETTKSVSILLVKPPAVQAKKFFKAKATLTASMKIHTIEWEDEPEWSGEIEVAQGSASKRDRSESRS